MPRDLPDVAHDVISEEVKLAISVGDLQGLLRNAERSGERTVKVGTVWSRRPDKDLEL